MILPFINIRKVPREMLKTSGFDLGFQHLPRDLSNVNNLIFFMFIRFPAILLVKTIDSHLHEFCARGILHSDFQ